MQLCAKIITQSFYALLKKKGYSRILHVKMGDNHHHDINHRVFSYWYVSGILRNTSGIKFDDFSSTNAC